MRLSRVSRILLILLVVLFVGCNNFALSLAKKEIQGIWVNEYSEGVGGILTLHLLSDGQFTWLDRQGDVEFENRRGSYFFYTNSKLQDKTQRATLVLKFEVGEGEEENFESFFFFFTAQEGKTFLNLQSLTKEGYTYSFLRS